VFLPISKIWQHSLETQWIGKISCPKYWWSVDLVILRKKALKFYFGLREPKLALWTEGGGGEEARGGDKSKFFTKTFHEIPEYTPVMEMLTKYK